MNAIATPFRQLVDRKLWPLAILLLAALAAVPFLLAKKDVAPAPSAGVATANAAAAQAPTQPIVTLGAPESREARRKVLGVAKDPFKPAVSAKKASATAPATTTLPDAAKGAAGAAGGAAAPVAGGGTQVVTPVPATPKKTYELYSLKVRFGPTSAQSLSKRAIKRLTALPKMAEPRLVYLGLKKDLKTAVFLVDANTLVVGDGKCMPSPSNCQTLELKKGQTAFMDILDATGQSTAQYEIDMVGIVKKKVADAKAAKSSLKATAKGGRDALRANVSRVGGWVYDAKTGVLVKKPAAKK